MWLMQAPPLTGDQYSGRDHGLTFAGIRAENSKQYLIIHIVQMLLSRRKLIIRRTTSSRLIIEQHAEPGQMGRGG